MRFCSKSPLGTLAAMTRLAILTVAWIVVATSAAAQTVSEAPPPRYGVDASSRHAPRGYLLLGYARSDPARWITEFWSVSVPDQRDQEKPTVVFARRALDAWKGQEQIQWADSRSCSGMIETLLEVNALDVPMIILPLDEAARGRRGNSGLPNIPAPDALGPYVFWAPGWGASAEDIQFTTYGGPWADWTERASSVMQSCWVSERPTYPSQRGPGGL